MHPLDIVLSLILLYGAWQGYRTGLVLVIINTLALLVSILLAFKFLHQAELFFQDWVGKIMLLPIVAFLGVFFSCFWFLRWFARLARRSLKHTLLGPADEAAGAVFGLTKMALVISSVLYGLRGLHLSAKIEGSQDLVLLPFIDRFGQSLFAWLVPLFPFLKKWLAGMM